MKRRVLTAMEQRAVAQGLAEPRVVAEQVFLLLKSVWATRRRFGPEAPLDNAAIAVQRLEAAAEGPVRPG